MASGPAVHTGGCQCGAVRFRATGTLDDVSICHCRMCQKAFGAYYAPLVTVPDGRLEWTRGAPRHFQSSNLVRRGFCEACGTPLTYESPNGVSVAAGAAFGRRLRAKLMGWLGTISSAPSQLASLDREGV